MTQAPHLLMNSRSGYKYGDVTVLDQHGLRRPARRVHRSADGRAHRAAQRRRPVHPGCSRTSSPRTSHQRAAAAWKDGVYADEVVPVKIPQRKGDPIEFTEDEGIRANTTAESLAGLKPAFRKDGTITAGSASQISDGACAVVVMNKAKAEELGLELAVRDRRARRGRGAGFDAAEPAGERHQEGDRQGGHLDRAARRRRDQRGVLGRRAGLDQGAGHRSATRSTSTAAPSRSVTRSACPVRGSRCTPPSSWPGAGSGYAVAALCGAGGQGDALILRRP